MNIKKEMRYEYAVLKSVFLQDCINMSESEFNYYLGQLNLLAHYTGNLKDYVINILRPVEEKIYKG